MGLQELLVRAKRDGWQNGNLAGRAAKGCTLMARPVK
jgi:hypothetical protein